MPSRTSPRDFPAEVRQAIEAIGNQVRTELLHELAGGERTTQDLADRIGTTRVSVHRHLRALEALGLVSASRPLGHRVGGEGGLTWTSNVEAIREVAARWAAYTTSREG